MKATFVCFCLLFGSLTHSAEIPSASKPELCAGDKERRHENGKCYKINRKGPCKDNQKFYEFGNITGVCDCEIDTNLLYWPKTDDCFNSNSKGPCNENEWIITSENNTVCAPLPDGCKNNGDYVYWSVLPNQPKKCYVLGEQGPCEPNRKLIKKGNVVLCGDGKYHAIVVPFRECPPGSRRYSLGCQKVYNFG